MKRLASVVFACLILISSGLVQTAFHFCPEDGYMFNKAACNMHQPAKTHDCCKKSDKITVKDDDCCSDNYLFSISAKFGSVQTEKLSIPEFSYVSVGSTIHSARMNNKITKSEITCNSPPGIVKPDILASHCVWVI